MRFLKRLVIIALGCVVLAALIAFALPREVHVSRSISIDAPPDEVFPLVNSLQEGQKWSPWLSLDPETRVAFSGPDAGVGNRLDWRSENPKVGAGTQIISASTPDRHVETTLDFGEMGTARAAFELEPAGTGTLIIWHFSTDTGLNPVARWTGLMMDRWVGRDYEIGLRNLKTLVESG